MARKKIKLITFDLDDTVWPNHKVIVDAEKALWNFLLMKVPQLKNDISEESINKIRLQLIEKDNSLKFNLTKFRKEVVKELLLKIGLDENEAIYYSNESFNEFFKVRNKVQLYKDAKNILGRLYRKVAIGSLSNGNADLRIIGIDTFFDFSINSKDVGSNKPAPPHFLRALELASCGPEEAIHVGDCPVNDVGGARNCNINAIWFNCEKNKWDEIFPCDLQAKSWKDLYEIVSKNFILEKKNV
ncbi:HAD family hydrolase [Gammaproteobacteria bacterium]|nr:HAD family hydrolase [Gammaproteobacteria bacterium]